MVNQSYKANSPFEAYQKAWANMAIAWEDTQLGRHLSNLKLIHFEADVFVLQADTEHVATVASRHAEMSIIKRTLATYLPDGTLFDVRVVTAEAVQDAR